MLKLIYTCFPSHLGESIRLSDYETSKQLFDSSELEEFRGFLTQTLNQINISEENFLRTGSMFFLKLAEGKSKSVIEKNIEILKSGIAYSFNFLQSLEKIYINGESILAKKVYTHSITYPINSSAYNIINPRNKERNIEAKFGFNPLYKDLVPGSVPNIYNFFSMDDEKNNFGFLIHCNAFDMHNDRRKLQPDSEINPRLFSYLIPDFLAFVNGTKGVKNWNNDIKKNVHVFNELYATLLLTEEPKTKSHLFEGIYLPIKKYISENIPTQNGYSNNSDNVKIKNTFLDISPSDFGCPDIEWFHWYNEKNDSIIINEARKSEKLNLEKWDIIDLIKYAVQQNKIENIDNWIKKIELETQQLFAEEKMLNDVNETQYFKKKTKPYYLLLSEINKSILKSNFEFVKQIKLFKFSDGKFYSLKEIFETDDLVLNYEKIFDIRYELQNIGFITSVINIDSINKKGIANYSNIKDLIQTKLSDLQLYQKIAEKVKTNTLRKEPKHKLFIAFQKFDGVDIEKLRDLELFKNSQGNVLPLKSLLKGDLCVSNWLFHFKIHIAEYIPELDKYLNQENDLFDKIILPNIEIIKEELTEAKEIKELLSFFKDNDRSFFNEYIIQKQTNGYEIIDKSDKYQIVPPNKETKEFIENYLSDELIILPYDFSDFKNENGIIKGEELHSVILDLVDVDEYKEILVNIAHYKEEKKLLLQKLAEIRLGSGQQYERESYEYKVLELACEVIKENEIQNFKEKIIIETEDTELPLSEIPPFIDKIKINGFELLLSKILPNSYENSNVLSELIEQFNKLGLQKDKLEMLFGISEEPKLSDIFKMFSEQINIVQNAEQLAFVLLYAKEFDENIENLKVETLDDKEWELKYNYYTKTLSFIGEDYLLKPQYSDVSKIIHLPIAICNSENKILQQPYFSENNFICPSLKSDLSEEEKLALTDFLYSEWRKDTNKQKVQSIDWSKINDTETNTVLGFTPNHSVFPKQYACDNEQLPDYLIKWIGKDENKIDFISDLGVWTERTVIVELRKFLQGEITEFHNNRLAQETRFNDDETNLFNTFEWLKENEIKLETAEQFETFKKVVDIINESRINKGALVIPDKVEEKYDFWLLNELSTKWEKEIENYSIYLYNGKMPVIVRLDEIDDYMFYSYPEGDYVVNENRIYINDTVDRNNILMQVATYLNDNDFTVSLFGSQNNNDEIEKLRAENQKLKDEKANNNQKESGNEIENPNSSFLDEVNDFIAELEDTDWNNYVPELKNLLLDFNNQPEEKRKLFNLIAKIKLTKEKNVKFEESDEGYNVVKIGDEKYFIHSARGAFAYIHPSELLKMKSDGYRMGIDFGKKFKIYENAEDIFELNKVHLLAYQSQNTTEDLLSFCQANRDANKHLLIIDKDNASEKSRALLKLLNIEDDYQ